MLCGHAKLVLRSSARYARSSSSSSSVSKTPSQARSPGAAWDRSDVSSAEGSDGLDETGAFEAAEDVGDGAWWVAPGVGDALDGAVNGLAVEVDLIEDELVGVFGFDVPAPKNGGGEVV